MAILVTSGLSGLWFFMSISSETVDLTAVVITSPSLGVFKNYVDKSKDKVRNIGVKLIVKSDMVKKEGFPFDTLEISAFW